MELVTTAVFGFVLFYAYLFMAGHVPVLAGMILSFSKEKTFTGENSRLPKISVIIPAKDEAETLPALFDSLLAQDYDDFEIVLVNDRSADNTLLVMNRFMGKYPDRVRIIDNKISHDGKNPKQMALALAENVASGDIFMYTDADCQVPSGWVRSLSAPFTDPEVGLVFGTVTVDGGKSLLEKFQQFDHILRYHYTAASAGLGMPTGGFGNNLAVRREALDDIGGFENLEYTVTEDAQLIAKVRDTGKWKIFAQTSRRSMVKTAAVRSWKELYGQELRWSTGAIHAPDFASSIGYGFIMYQLLTGILFLVPAFFRPELFIAFFAGIICMFLVSLTAGIHLRLDRVYWLYLPVCILIAQFLFPVVTARAAVRPLIVWKGTLLD